jgi:RNA polymerase sigma-70 factor (ECF subfamily)
VNDSELLESIFREQRPRLIAYLVGRLHDLEPAEDSLQAAALRARERWAAGGVPESPISWLATVAYRAALDELRRRKRHGAVDTELVERAPDPGDDVLSRRDIPDERLSLMLMLCHPAVSPAARVPLVLQELAGFTAQEIGRAFVTPAPTMAQRLVRAKRKIRDARVPFAIPEAGDLPDRIGSVRHAVYLIFTEGHSATRGTELERRDLMVEAIALGRMLLQLSESHRLTSELPETTGLVALMLLHYARREARTAGDGSLTLLADQDRLRWDHALIREAVELLDGAVAVGRPGPFQIEAAIASLHAQAPTLDKTDWTQMLLLYNRLRDFRPGIVTEVNRAVVLAKVHGPDAAIGALEDSRTAPNAARYAPLFLALAEVYREVDQLDVARRHYERAASLSGNIREQEHIQRRMASLSPTSRFDHA